MARRKKRLKPRRYTCKSKLAVETLAREYQGKLGLPRGARLDVVHLACVVADRLDYLLTWNCAHLANGEVIRRLQAVNTMLGRETPIIVTPEELLISPEGG